MMEANNMAAMCEALENSNGLLEELAVIGEWGESAREQIAENNASLSAPPRNCDVGTAEEHEDRYEAFCAKHFARDIDRYDNPCGSCPLSSQANLCKFAWAQMPYEANEKGEVDDSNG